MSNNNVFRIILSAAIIAGFFLPWFNFFGGESGWDTAMTKGGGDPTADMIIRYSFLLIPLFALIVLVLSLSKKRVGFMLRAASFIVLAILSALFILGARDSNSDLGLNGFFSFLGYGLYITAAASFLLMFVGGKAAAVTAT